MAFGLFQFLPSHLQRKASIVVLTIRQSLHSIFNSLQFKGAIWHKRRRSGTKKGDVGIRVDKQGGKGVKQSAWWTETTSKQKDGDLGVNWGVT